MSPTEIGLFIGQAVTLIGLVVSLVSRRMRTPGDDQARIEAGIRILENQLSRNAQEQTRWLDVEKYLREQLAKADEKDARQDAEIEQLRSLVAAAQSQISELTLERDDLRTRIARLAEKYARGEAITLVDIVGHDLEDTYPSVHTALAGTE